MSFITTIEILEGTQQIRELVGHKLSLVLAQDHNNILGSLINLDSQSGTTIIQAKFSGLSSSSRCALERAAYTFKLTGTLSFKNVELFNQAITFRFLSNRDAKHFIGNVALMVETKEMPPMFESGCMITCLNLHGDYYKDADPSVTGEKLMTCLNDLEGAPLLFIEEGDPGGGLVGADAVRLMAD